MMPDVSGGLTAIVLAGGEDGPAAAPDAPGAFVVAADSGAAHALALGLAVDVVVGDFDSIDPDDLELLEQRGARIERHPVVKDATDLELALGTALEAGAGRIVVLGGALGRLDHLLGELLLLASDRLAHVEVDAQLGRAAVHVIRGTRVLAGVAGEIVSLFAVHGPARGVTTEGLVYPLSGDALEPGSTLGVSNAFAAPAARVTVEQGVVVAVRPDGLL